MLGVPYVREAGSGPAVVLIHAGGSNSGQWRPLMERLGSRFRVLACDLSGSGKSPAFPAQIPYTLDEEITFLGPVFEAAGAGFHLVGHSYGGAVALKAALRHRSRVRSLTLFEPVLFSPLIASAPQSDAAREISRIAESTTRHAEREDFESGAREFVDYWFEPGTWAAMREQLRAPIRAAMRYTRPRWDALFHDPVRVADLAKLDVVTLFVIARNSPLSARVLAELLLRALPNAHAQYIRGVGHMAPLTHPERVNPLIEAFLREQGR